MKKLQKELMDGSGPACIKLIVNNRFKVFESSIASYVTYSHALATTFPHIIFLYKCQEESCGNVEIVVSQSYMEYNWIFYSINFRTEHFIGFMSLQGKVAFYRYDRQMFHSGSEIL